MEISPGLQKPLIQFFLHKFEFTSGAIRSLFFLVSPSQSGLFILNALKVH